MKKLILLLLVSCFLVMFIGKYKVLMAGEWILNERVHYGFLICDLCGPTTFISDSFVIGERTEVIMKTINRHCAKVRFYVIDSNNKETKLKENTRKGNYTGYLCRNDLSKDTKYPIKLKAVVTCWSPCQALNTVEVEITAVTSNLWVN